MQPAHIRRLAYRMSLLDDQDKKWLSMLTVGHGIVKTQDRWRVDVLAVKDGIRIGVEIETGKSDVVQNMRLDLQEGYDEVIVVATDEKALHTVERQLARVELIIPGRVRVVLRDGFMSCTDVE